MSRTAFVVNDQFRSIDEYLIGVLGSQGVNVSEFPADTGA
jgi:hypothetical protein